MSSDKKPPVVGKTTIELNEEIKDCRAIIRSNKRILKKRDKNVKN